MRHLAGALSEATPDATNRHMDKIIRKYADFDEMKADDTATGKAVPCMSVWQRFPNSPESTMR